MKWHFISDTHGFHGDLGGTIPDCDILAHCGDVGGETQNSFKDFLKWFASQPARHKVFIAGNHDWYLFNKGDGFPDYMRQLMIDGNVTYLQDSSIDIEGHVIYGTPWSPRFYNWSFMEEDDPSGLGRIYRKMPQKIDVLLSHCPAFGEVDEVFQFREQHTEHVGSKELKKAIDSRDIKRVCCGHIHEARGVSGNGKYINAACWNHKKGTLTSGFTATT